MHVMHDLVRSARLVEEGHEHQAPGIEAREQSRDDQQHGEGEACNRRMRCVGASMMASFEKKPAVPNQRERNADAGDARACRSVIIQNVTGMCGRRPPMLRMSCSPSTAWMTEPAQRNSSALKKACVNRWKMAGAIGADAERDEHVAELRAGRIGDDALDVVLHEADGRREEGGDRADDGDDVSASATVRTAATCGRRGRRRR
jgi:hypothetical protein